MPSGNPEESSVVVVEEGCFSWANLCMCMDPCVLYTLCVSVSENGVGKDVVSYFMSVRKIV